MDARERWQALQARLTAARAAVDAGNRERALDEITAALDLDKDFLAAQALRDRIVSMSAESSPAHEALPSPPPPLAAAVPAPADATPVEGSPPILAKFEQRAKRRRVDRRIDAARAAIAAQCLKAAAAALDEIIDLDPNLPELAELTAQFDELRRAVATPRRGAWLAATAVFALALFGGSWLQDSAPILSRQIIVSAAPLPFPGASTTTVGRADDHNAPAIPAASSEPVVESASIASLPPQPVDESVGVKELLLASQWIVDGSDDPVTFDSCDPHLDGDAAIAECLAGSQTWNVTLRKVGATWKIEGARVER
jgi:hypothetical protein